ncbi:DUF92 domain-containing protein [Fictibacillus iocasae]|uniref:DUF92 domain-containing protein n=1 Tax=Fictibacillus iocasae TaxID=2715437 RepID=A0ABW2NIA4_9BACL
MYAAIIGISLFCVIILWQRLLTKGGALAAFFLGVTSFAAFGGRSLMIIGAFFVSSMLWTKVGKSKKDESQILRHESGGRSAGQVLANGGAGLLAALLSLLFPSPIWIAAFAASFAEAAADTWASELGFLSKSKPYHIKLRKRVEAGLSGAVSTFGTAAAIAGGAFISVISLVLYDEITPATLVFILIGAIAGCFADTLFGAYVEPSYTCRVCGIQTEADEHCGWKPVKIWGSRLMTNNAVNFLSSLTAGGLALAASALLA